MTGTVNTITSQNIIDACGGIATSATSLHPIVGSFKIRSIKMWSPSVSNALANCSVAWEGGVFGLNTTVQDSSISVTTPAMVFAKPPTGSTANFWQSSANLNTLFTISSNVSNTIVDIKLSCVFSDNSSVPSAIVVVGASVGSIYFLGLDGLPVATSKFIPIGVPTGV
jgi:hypothetical protein